MAEVVATVAVDRERARVYDTAGSRGARRRPIASTNGRSVRSATSGASATTAQSGRRPTTRSGARAPSPSIRAPGTGCTSRRDVGLRAHPVIRAVAGYHGERRRRGLRRRPRRGNRSTPPSPGGPTGSPRPRASAPCGRPGLVFLVPLLRAGDPGRHRGEICARSTTWAWTSTWCRSTTATRPRSATGSFSPTGSPPWNIVGRIRGA